MLQKESFKILIIADPLAKIKSASDTSVAFCEGALESNDTVHWCEPHQVIFYGAEVAVRDPIRITKASTESIESKPEAGLVQLKTFDFAFVRKDPPFDDKYCDLCWLLASQTSTKVVNSAESLLTFHEKAVQWRAAAEGYLSDANLVPTCVSSVEQDFEDFAALQTKQAQLLSDAASKKNLLRFVLKPWLGHGGEDIHLCDSSQSVIETFRKFRHADNEKWMLQPFLPEVTEAGDRRVLLVCGEVVGSFVRIPAKGRIESNLAQGGRAEAIPMTASQVEVMKRLGKFLSAHNIAFAGADLIGDRVGEVNITSPTGVRSLEKLEARKFAKAIYSKLVGRN